MSHGQKINCFPERTWEGRFHTLPVWLRPLSAAAVPQEPGRRGSCSSAQPNNSLVLSRTTLYQRVLVWNSWGVLDKWIVLVCVCAPLSEGTNCSGFEAKPTKHYPFWGLPCRDELTAHMSPTGWTLLCWLLDWCMSDCSNSSSSKGDCLPR